MTDKQTTAITDPIYLGQLRNEWLKSREHLARSAAEGRLAQRVWDSAVTREMEAHKRMSAAYEAAGVPLPLTENADA